MHARPRRNRRTWNRLANDETGELLPERRLDHQSGEAHAFYRSLQGAGRREFLNHPVRGYLLRAAIVALAAFPAVLYLYSEVSMLAIRLPQTVEKRLEKLARRTGRTKTFYVREAILQHLEDLEDLYLAEGALERIRSGEERTIPLKDAVKRHGLQR